jgi:hypothetical protein
MALGTAIFLLLGIVLENAAPVSTADFRLMYYSARCVLEHQDPYLEQKLERVYQLDGGETAHDTPLIRKTETQLIYLPTAFTVTIPFALFPFGPAHIVWLAVTALSLVVSALLIWHIAAAYAPVLSGGLIAFALANCPLFLAIAGPGGIVIGFCMIAVWCFVRERFELVGVFLLAISLMLKPHDSGLIWFYFLIAGGAYRKRALQTLLAVVALSLPSVLWLSHVAPCWIQELHSNLVANAAHGGLSDPGIASTAGHGIVMIISLQTIFSFFQDKPDFYNPASYFVCGALLVVWLVKTIRLSPSEKNAWFALAPIAAFSMLPVYHRLDDAKLLMLAVPACAILWRERRRRAWIGVAITSAGIVFTAALPWAVFFSLLQHVSLHETEVNRRLVMALQIFPAPLTLFIMGTYFLWIYVSRAPYASSSSNI